MHEGVAVFVLGIIKLGNNRRNEALKNVIENIAVVIRESLYKLKAMILMDIL